jgi:ribonuclease R
VTPRTHGDDQPRSTLVVSLDTRGRFLVGEPFFERGRQLAVEADRRARPGDLALVRVGDRGRGRAKVLRRLGRHDVARDVIEALMLDRGLRRGFDPAVEREAREAKPVDDDGSRRDLTGLTTFTIDPVTARDFDDAISAEPLADGMVRVWVHIADVSAHVRPGSLVDRDAHRRGTSVYVPGAVEPMLPEALSNDACSLVPHRDRPTVTVEMDFQGHTVRRSAFYRSTIRSDERLDYDRVDRIFAGDERALEPWAPALEAARDVSRELDAERSRQGALAVETAEPEFEFGDDGSVVAQRHPEATESHRLIEHLMIAANEQVATLLEEHKIPALYRVHEQPDPQRVEQLADQLASLEVATPPLRENMSAQQAADAVAEMARSVDAHVRRTGRGRVALTSLVLRTLKQAHYSPRNVGHAGLRSPRYCHFTSPIRRYPDLVCHRALLSAIGGGEEAPQGGDLERSGAWASAREREAMVIERDADDVARCFLLERELRDRGWDAPWEGEVVGLIGAGAFVAFGDGHQGLLPVRRLRGDWWELSELGTILHGTRTGRVLRLGDPVLVAVERVDTARGRVDLVAPEL